MNKSILSNYFEKVYVITCFESYERLNPNSFITDDYELVVAPKQQYFKSVSDDYCSGAISLASANQSIILKSKLKGYKSICILEDDIFHIPNYKPKLEKFFNHVENWDILNLGFHVDSKINFKSDNSIYHRLTTDDVVIGTHIMGYKHTVYDFLLDKYKNNNSPIDWFLDKIIYSEFKSYVPTDKIFYCSSYREKDKDKDESYKKYKSVITMHT